MPEITGETASGRSISVMRKLLPWNSNLAMDQAAARPKTMLIGTTTSATVNVKRIAARVSGSRKLPKYGPNPLARAMAMTVASGANSSAARNTSDTVMKAQRTSVPVSVPLPGRVAISSRMVMGSASTNAPSRPAAAVPRLAEH